MAERPKKLKLKLDWMTVLGLLVATVGIVGGLVLEGGAIQDVAQVTAGIIVVGGTLGAVMVNTPGPVLRGAIRRFREVFFAAEVPVMVTVEEVVSMW